MTFFDQAWRDAAADNWGNAAQLSLIVVARDGTHVDLTASETIVNVNPVVRQTERFVGIMQGQTFEVELTRSQDLIIPPQGYDGCWAQLRADFGAGPVPVATGTIHDIAKKSDALLSITFDDPLVQIVGGVFAYNAGLLEDGWAGPIEGEDAQGTYDNQSGGVSIVASNPEELPSGEFRIVFTTTTGFVVYRPDGQLIASGNITTDCMITSGPPTYESLLLIESDGWDGATGAYEEGDTFTFGVTAAASDLDPASLLQYLVTQHAKIQVYDFQAEEIGATFYDSAGVWAEQIAARSSEVWQAVFAKGSSVADAIQAILRGTNWALFCAPDGRVALFAPRPDANVVVDLNGDPGLGDVHVLESSSRDNMRYVANEVRFEYLDASAVERYLIRRDSETPYDQTYPATFDLRPWRLAHAAVRSAAIQTLARLKRARKEFVARGTLAGAGLIPGEIVRLTDSAAGIHGEVVVAAKVTSDFVGDTSEIIAYHDPLAAGGYARVGNFDTNPIGTRIGGLGDPGAAVVW